MRAKYETFVSGLLVVATLLVVGCSKMSEEEAQIRQHFSSIPSDMPVKNLGEIQFISGSPKAIELDDGQSLIITATTQPDETIQIVLEFESNKRAIGNIIKETYTHRSRFLLRPGMRCAPKLGDLLAIVFSPKIIDQEEEILL